MADADGKKTEVTAVFWWGLGPAVLDVIEQDAECGDGIVITVHYRDKCIDIIVKPDENDNLTFVGA